jgi:hypothetical protein
MPSLVAVACFLPGRAKDLSAPPCNAWDGKCEKCKDWPVWYRQYDCNNFVEWWFGEGIME